MVTSLDAKEISLSLLLSTWLLVTVIRQTRRRKPNWLLQIDFFRLIPTWRFFGPNPVTWDYRLHFRTRSGENDWSTWRDITPNKSREVVSFFWNPEKRIRKVFSTASRRVIKSRKSEFNNSWEYWMILRYVLAQSGESDSGPCQFEISRCRLLSSPEHRDVMFRSDTINVSEITAL